MNNIMIKKNILIFLLLGFTVLGFAQNPVSEKIKVMDYSLPKEYTIVDITVSGVEFLQKEVLISLSGLKKGSKITVPGD